VQLRFGLKKVSADGMIGVSDIIASRSSHQHDIDNSYDGVC